MVTPRTLQDGLNNVNYFGEPIFAHLIDEPCSCGDRGYLSVMSAEEKDWAFFLCWRVGENEFFWKYMGRIHAYPRFNPDYLNCKRDLACGTYDELWVEAERWVRNQHVDMFPLKILSLAE